jgi:hypothetical protein
MGWAVVICSVLVALALLSFLALDKPNVVWVSGAPHCPQCRTQVAPYAIRCPACREPFDWVTAREEDSPHCTHCLTAAEDEGLRARRQTVGDETAAELVAGLLHLPAPAAKEYLLAVGRGQCGWCGGTGRDLAAAERVPCLACSGSGRCAACDGDRRVRVGLEAAGVEIDRYKQLAMTLFGEGTPVPAARLVLGEANADFLRRFAGTSEVAQLYFPPEFRAGTPPAPYLVAATRGRLESVLRKLAGP